MPKGSKAELIPSWDSQLNISSPVQQIKNQCIPVKFIFTTIVCGNAIQWKEVQNHHPCNRFKTSASQCACSSLKFIFTTTVCSEERCKSSLATRSIISHMQRCGPYCTRMQVGIANVHCLASVSGVCYRMQPSSEMIWNDVISWKQIFKFWT